MCRGWYPPAAQYCCQANRMRLKYNKALLRLMGDCSRFDCFAEIWESQDVFLNEGARDCEVKTNLTSMTQLLISVL
jgi:hypothetical protein